MTDLYIGKINFLHMKKHVFILITLFTINSLFLIYTNICQDLPTITVQNEDSVRLKKKLRHSYSSAALVRSQMKNVTNMKYILQWNVRWIFEIEKEGQTEFIEANCEYTNCFVTSSKDYLGDYTKFDVIIFGPLIVSRSNNDLPQIRLPHQKYIFASMESSAYYPVCSDRFDGYFNWTWTFRFDSDLMLGFMVIKDMNGTIIGPNKEMHWMKLEDMDPTPEHIRENLKHKKKFAAWLVSNCYSKDQREYLIKALNKELKGYGDNYQVDIYGLCGDKVCPPDMFCEEMIYYDYWFYLAFENSYNPDYVTEKLLRALEFYSIPVVYGGANYTRFMPDGIYLDAKKLGVKKLAAKMVEIANDFEKFAEYFKWKKYYTFSPRSMRPDTNNYCALCALLNNEKEMCKTTIKKNFQEWWDLPNACS